MEARRWRVNRQGRLLLLRMPDLLRLHRRRLRFQRRRRQPLGEQGQGPQQRRRRPPLGGRNLGSQLRAEAEHSSRILRPWQVEEPGQVRRRRWAFLHRGLGLLQRRRWQGARERRMPQPGAARRRRQERPGALIHCCHLCRWRRWRRFQTQQRGCCSGKLVCLWVLLIRQR